MKSESKKNFFLKRSLINTITITRLAAILILFIDIHPIFILALSIGVGISDFLDGYLARAWKCETSFGKSFDQLVDKIVAIVFLLFYYHLNEIQIWFVILFILRELLVILGRKIKVIESNSNYFGKVKTFLFYIFIIFISCRNYDSQFCLTSYSFLVLLLEMLILFFSYFAILKSISKSIQDKIVVILGSTFYSAYLVKKMPGTISSLFVFLILYYFSAIAIEYKIVFLALFILVHFVIYPLFEKIYQKEDVSFYTIDETIAILLLWLLPVQGPLIWTMYFVLFRFFDIFKPLGIKKIETTNYLSKSMRIMADDLLAILYTIIIIYVFKEFI